MPVLRRTLKILENLTGSLSVVMAIFQVSAPLCDPLAVGSYLIHMLKTLIFR